MKEQKKGYAAYLAFDWSHESQRFAFRAADCEEIKEGDLANRPEEMYEWFSELRKRFPEGKIAVVLEQGRGALLNFLAGLDYVVIFAVNPKAVARYREAFQVSGCKDDPTDTLLMLDFLYKHHQQLRPLELEEESVEALRMLVEARRGLVDQRTKLVQKLNENLKAYYPQAIDWVGELTSLQACDFLNRWSNLLILKRAKPYQIRTFYHRHRCRVKVEERITQIGESRPLTHSQAVLTSCSCVTKGLANLIKQLTLSISDIDKEIRQAYRQFPERHLYNSLPGAGEVLEPRLAAFLGTDRQRFNSAVEVQNASGISPITKQSGATKVVLHRYACSKFDKQTFHEFAGCSISWCNWARAEYRYLREERGKNHHSAVRALAYKWIRILFRCWKGGVPYEEEIYLKALRRRNSPVLKFLNDKKAKQSQVTSGSTNSVVNNTKPNNTKHVSGKNTWRSVGSLIPQNPKELGRIANDLCIRKGP